MKRIFSFLFAILFAVGTTSVFTSCQEDAPEITINITMNNDFSDVVNAINNGTMKQEAAIAALTAAIEKMQGDQDSKQQAIADAINSLASTLDAKLAIIEAAMKAQTLALETKFDLLETALEAIAENIKAQEGQYADELAALTEAIDAIKSEVAAGNKSQEDALAEIIALLESGAIAGGGSGSGSGGEGSGGEGSGGEGSGGEGSGGEGSGGEGSGGEGSGDEPTGPYILLTTGRPVGITIEFICPEEVKSISGAVDLRKIGTSYGYPLYEATLTSQEVKVYGTFTVFYCENMNLTKINTDTQSSLEEINLRYNPDLEFNFKFNSKLKHITLTGVNITKSKLSDLVGQLPASFDAKCWLNYNDAFDDDVYNLLNDATDKGWTFFFS